MGLFVQYGKHTTLKRSSVIGFFCTSLSRFTQISTGKQEQEKKLFRCIDNIILHGALEPIYYPINYTKGETGEMASFLPMTMTESNHCCTTVDAVGAQHDEEAMGEDNGEEFATGDERLKKKQQNSVRW